MSNSGPRPILGRLEVLKLALILTMVMYGGAATYHRKVQAN